jgi:predicted transposase YbfD/YdcC
MSRAKSNTENNEIVQGLAVISEAFKAAHITEDDTLEVCAAIDFVHFFDNLTDIRDRDRITYRLPNLLMMVFLLILKGSCSKSFYAMAAYIRLRKDTFEKYGLIENGQCPSHDTLRRVFELLNGQEIYEQTVQRMYEFLKLLEEEIQGKKQYKQIIVDGKECRGTGRAEGTRKPQSNIQILNIYDESLKTCIHSELIDDKTNEIPVAQKYLEGMNLRHVVVTADALHCQRNTCKVITDQKGCYVLTVRENQPSLQKEIDARIDRYTDKVTKIKRGGRTFEIYVLPKGYAVDGFAGMKTMVRMQSRVHSKDKVTTRRFIASTKDTELICEAIENRWDIENGLHREKDNHLKEDLFRSSYRNTVLNMAIMNNLAAQMIRIYQAISDLSPYMAKMDIKDEPIPCLKKIVAVMNSEEVITKVKEEIVKVKKLKLQNKTACE